jgi:hypothetical protein
MGSAKDNLQLNDRAHITRQFSRALFPTHAIGGGLPCQAVGARIATARETCARRNCKKHTICLHEPSVVLTAPYADDILNDEADSFFPQRPEEHG